MGKLFPFLLNIILLSTVVENCSVKQAVEFFQIPLNKFRSELMTRISEDTNNHFVASSFSLWTLLASITFAATETTLDELQYVLRFESEPCERRKFFEFVNGLSADDDEFMFKRRNFLFGEKNLLFKKTFRQQLQLTGLTKLEEISFANKDEVAEIINQYVKSAIGGSTTKTVKPEDVQGAEVVLIDALCFKSLWKYQFVIPYTSPYAFYDSDEDRIGHVNIMYNKLETYIADIPEIYACVLELPYDNDRFSMIFILPNKGVPVDKVVETLKNYNVHLFFERFSLQIVTVRIPRFKISAGNNLKRLLIDMGLENMFSANATFPEMAENSVHVSNVIQNTTIEVTEDGCEVSLQSTVYMVNRLRSNEIVETSFLANRPFLYMIVEKRTEIMIFIGAYSKPSLY